MQSKIRNLWDYLSKTISSETRKNEKNIKERTFETDLKWGEKKGKNERNLLTPIITPKIAPPQYGPE